MVGAMELKDVRNRLRALGRSQADLARHLELDPSSLTKTLNGERRLQAFEVVKLEEFFGDKLAVGGEPRAIGARRHAAVRRVPVYGYAAAGGDERIAFADDRVLEWREPPPFWNGAGELIYVRIIGESMEPRYFSGEVVPVRYGVPPAKNEDCLLEFTDNSVMIKTFGGHRDTTVFARQYNPPQELRLPAVNIRAVHAVWRPSLI